MTPATLSTQELRLATTMTGGVSLSVWMGGVTREINLLLQASECRRAGADPVQGILSTQAFASLKRYHELLNLLDTVVDVDVLSGTSAGGINAVLLGYARVNNRDLGSLRDLWLELGAFESLLRNPADAVVPSLFYGDERMFSALGEKMPLLKKTRIPRNGDRECPPTTLLVTTTLLTGEASRFTDSFGTVVQDVNQRGLFTFDEQQLADPQNVSALALAGRSSASYPAAFEPSFLPFGHDVDGRGDVPERPDMAPFLNTTRAHWAADGGLLDNQPLDVILDRVFRRPAEGPVRRVLLYVVPTAGPAPDLIEGAPQDDVKNPYGLLDGLLKDLSAVTGQSIARDLRAITEHNDRIDSRRDRRRQLCELAVRLLPESAETSDRRLLTSQLFADCLQQLIAGQAQLLVRPMLEVLSTWTPQAASRNAAAASLPPAWQAQLEVGGGAEEKCRSTIEEGLREAYTERLGGAAVLPNSVDNYAALGPDLLQGAKSIVLAVLHPAYTEADPRQRQTLSELVRRVHDATPVEPGVSLSAVTSALTAARDANAETLVDAAKALTDAYLAWFTTPRDAWTQLAGVLLEVSVPVPRGGNTLDPLMIYLRPMNANSFVVAQRLFDLAAVERAMEPIDVGRDQRVELVQVSADTRTALDPRRDSAKSKLTGMQFHHFGAFYKASWRANDWMWGRLDGAGWLVHILLDPRRLKIVTEAVPNGKAQWLLAELAKLVPTSLQNNNDGLKAELAFLDEPASEMPLSLPKTALWLAQAWQSEVLDEELPTLADAILGSPGETTAADGRPPDWHPARSRIWAAQVRAPGADLTSLLATCPVPAETLDSDKGSPLMRRTLTKAAATAAAAVGSVRQLPGPVRPAAAVLHTLTFAAYRIVNGLKGSSLWMIVAGGLLLTFGVLAALLSWTVPAIAGGGAAAVGGYLIVLGTWQRSSRLLSALVSFMVILAVAALTAPVVRRGLFGTSEKDGGVVGRNIYWVGSEWWRPLIVILVAVVIITGIIFITSAGARSIFAWLTGKLRRPPSNSTARADSATD